MVYRAEELQRVSNGTLVFLFVLVDGSWHLMNFQRRGIPLYRKRSLIFVFLFFTKVFFLVTRGRGKGFYSDSGQISKITQKGGSFDSS